jgi:hypothetical protein
LQSINVLQDKYHYDLPHRQTSLIETLGQDRVDQLKRYLDSPEVTQLINRQPMKLTLADIQPSNIIKRNDRLSLVDWERISKTNNPAENYGLLFTTLWSNPELQIAYYQQVMELNQHNSEFAELFRLDFLYNRGTGELTYWHQQSLVAKTAQELDLYLEAEQQLASMVNQALYQQGVWS